MNNSRRRFLKVASLSFAGLSLASVAGGVTKAQAASSEYIHGPNQLTAKRWAMVIDMTKFESQEDYDRVIHACHSVHNVPKINTNQEIKWLWTDSYQATFPDDSSKHVSTEVLNRKYLMLCNHCENPPCVRACPTQATFQREDGIVVMDYHRCIGCRFCMAGCPYGARSFNFFDPRPYIEDINPTFPARMRGVVEKCTFCSERLAEGLLPACVEASNGAILFGDLDDPESPVRVALSENFSIRRKPSLGTEPGVYYIV
ncbi:MAG: 4Fe-4S dicluster domain-containing protein [Pseudomonadota bacterium]